MSRFLLAMAIPFRCDAGWRHFTASDKLFAGSHIQSLVQQPRGFAMKLFASLLALFLSFAAPAADAPHKTSKPMKIGIIGTGDIGGALARHWARAGHQLLISSR